MRFRFPHFAENPRWRIACALALAGVLLIPAGMKYLGWRAEVRDSSPAKPEAASNARAGGNAAAHSAAQPAGASQEPAKRAGVDASNFYKNAFVLCAALTDDEKKMFRQPPAEADADKAAALFKKIQPILELLRQAAEADYCEWGLGEVNFETPMPQISKVIELGRLAQWSAGYRFPSDPQGALGDLSAQARLGGHVADSVIGWLVQVSLETGANKVLSQNAGMLDEAATRQVRELLQSSSIEENIARAFATESAGVEAMAGKLAALTPAERTKLFQTFSNPSVEDANPALRRFLESDAAMNAEFQYLRQIERQLAEAMQWPEARYQAWWKSVENRMPEHPLAAVTLPALTSLRTSLQRTQVERAMLNAGLTLLQSGPEQFAQFRDPVINAPFSYVEKPDGFELRSAFKKNGEPVTMSFTLPR